MNIHNMTSYQHMMTSSNGNIFRVTGLCAGKSPVPGEFPAQRPVTRSFGVFFDLRLNKRLSKQSWGWWYATPSHSLSWRQCNDFHEINEMGWIIMPPLMVFVHLAISYIWNNYFKDFQSENQFSNNICTFWHYISFPFFNWVERSQLRVLRQGLKSGDKIVGPVIRTGPTEPWVLGVETDGKRTSSGLILLPQVAVAVAQCHLVANSCNSPGSTKFWQIDIFHKMEAQNGEESTPEDVNVMVPAELYLRKYLALQRRCEQVQQVGTDKNSDGR